MSTWVLATLWLLTCGGIVGAFGIIHLQENVTERLTAGLIDAENAVENAQYEQADQALKAVINEWGSIAKLWALHTQHEELDPVQDALLQAEALIQLQQPEALAALRVARSRLGELPQRDRPILSNLL